MTNQDEEWIAEKAWTIANDLFAEILMGARAEMMARDDIVFMTYIKLGMIGYVQVALREALARGERREREREIVLMPAEPTPAMRECGLSHWLKFAVDDPKEAAAILYHAMIRARPARD